MFKRRNIVKSYIRYEIALEDEIMGININHIFFLIIVTPLFCKNTTPLYPALIKNKPDIDIFNLIYGLQSNATKQAQMNL